VWDITERGGQLIPFPSHHHHFFSLEDEMSNADAMIAALRSGYDELAGIVRGLSDDDLAGPSGASEWDISQVLSHLGSGAVIGEAGLRAALDSKPRAGQEFNVSVWSRWDGMGRRERADEFLVVNESLTALWESLSPAVREEQRIDLGFLPAPVDVATAARFRLNELSLHSWDVRVGLDPSATVRADAAELLAPTVGQLAGFLGKPSDPAIIAVETSGPSLRLGLRLGERVSVSDEAPEAADGTLSLPGEAWVRLVTGRLKEPYTPAGISVTGAADLGVLRKVFPGF
jgi:uncharacterized protein (TIGR03083 family)